MPLLIYSENWTREKCDCLTMALLFKSIVIAVSHRELFPSKSLYIMPLQSLIQRIIYISSSIWIFHENNRNVHAIEKNKLINWWEVKRKTPNEKITIFPYDRQFINILFVNWTYQKEKMPRQTVRSRHFWASPTKERIAESCTKF